MNRVMLALVTGLFVAGSFATISPASAQGRLNILIMGEDLDKDTIPRGNRVFNRVVASLQNELHVGGYDVWDEVAVTGHLAQDRSRRTKQEIIAVSRLIQRPPIDIAVVFSIYPSAVKTQIATMVSVRIEGHLFNMPEGRVMGNFEVKSPGDWTAPYNCDENCLLESVGDHAKMLASALGDVLTEMLDDQAVQGGGVVADGGGIMNTWALVFDGFNDEDALLIEDYLVVFTGYDSHTPIFSMPRHSEISYKSTIEDAKLVRNLNLMLERIGVSGRVFAASGEITVVKVRSQERRVNAEGM